jgi:hypothetical protein
MPKEHRAGSGRPALLSLNIFMIQSTGVLIKIALAGQIVIRGTGRGVEEVREGGQKGKQKQINRKKSWLRRKKERK